MLNDPIHPSVTPERVEEATRNCMFGLDNIGICTLCGEEQDGCEPDAQDYTCETCGAPAVYGAEELLFHIVA